MPQLLGRADAALYEAKRLGRNRIYPGRLSMGEHIVVETQERVTRIEFDRPEKKNALSPAMYAAMAQALAAADADAQVRAVLIHGQAGCFTSGNDVKDFLELPRGPGESPAAGFLRAISTAKEAPGRCGGRAGGRRRHHDAAALRPGVRGAERAPADALRAAGLAARGGLEPAAAGDGGLPARGRDAAARARLSARRRRSPRASSPRSSPKRSSSSARARPPWRSRRCRPPPCR